MFPLIGFFDIERKLDYFYFTCVSAGGGSLFVDAWSTWVSTITHRRPTRLCSTRRMISIS